MDDSGVFDLFIIGGGINGCGIARDAAGRGLSVCLAERDDLACATSSASSKLIHGGLRYLEQYEFRLVSEALGERETLLRMAPHIIWPLTFVLPWVPEMRPRWMLRAGMWLYDHLAGRSLLPGSKGVDLRSNPLGAGLSADFRSGFSYSDCGVDDSRLTLLNARSAAELGAQILTRTTVQAATRERGLWRVVATQAGQRVEFHARALVNAAGPWARAMLERVLDREIRHSIRLVKGSHIVTRKLYDGDHAYILQNDDKRVVLVIPYRGSMTLIGTTDMPITGEPANALISAEEIAYLTRAVSRYFAAPVTSSDVLWSYSGVRPLYDDGSANPSEVTRDYKLLVDAEEGAPLLAVYGGKITTFRKLAEHALAKLKPWFPRMAADWTGEGHLPGGDIEGADFAGFLHELRRDYSGLPPEVVDAVARRHGTLARQVLGAAAATDALGVHFGAGLYGREVDWFLRHEWARSADDILWRRTKAGLDLTDSEQQTLARYVATRAAFHGSVAEPVR